MYSEDKSIEELRNERFRDSDLAWEKAIARLPDYLQRQEKFRAKYPNKTFHHLTEQEYYKMVMDEFFED